MDGKIRIGNKQFLQDFLVHRIKNDAELDELNRMYDVAVEVVTNQLVLDEDRIIDVNLKETKKTKSTKGVF
tara:strand:- start:676 stop:888 length:213 start_codon:yes stop_codon:yes gene_type:complete